jgi:hypothetical protein
MRHLNITLAMCSLLLIQPALAQDNAAKSQARKPI